ncbi:MAG: tRNA (adenosine(37)-N6)-threonylcarbamoyltransferase complex ATPase subunit type 1 TsaE [Clostridia bacterium]|nr:tRNA (adenosine(37)-N6)-threonylcarbamoyltransferase complex ATPase subunit type 1 TsaE [Clostridia bacterium]
MSEKLKSLSVEETVEIGHKLAARLVSGDIVTLDGDLGAGKTVITRGITEALDINARVCSPTYTIVNEYTGDEDSKVPAVFHFDTYRLTGSDDFLDSGLDEYFYRDGICIIEWSSVIEDLLEDMNERRIVRVTITGTGDERDINIEGL